jgi:SAM-dependent methyltransferase
MTGKPGLSRDAAYFAALYAADPDPWNFSASAYERQKYEATIAALGGRHFSSAFEVGCSIGILTRMLAPRCAALLAADIVKTALDSARANCADMPQVRFANLGVPGHWPAGETFDLILLSEMLYFLNPTDIVTLAGQAAASLLPGGIILLVNYTGRIDEPSSGDDAAEIFIAATRSTLGVTLQQREERFRIDRLEMRDRK